MKTIRLSAILALVSATPLFQLSLKAEDWNVAVGNWNDPGNWTPASVPSGTPANINNAGTATLDSVVPNSLVLGKDTARNLDAALKRQFARCAAEAACAHQLGDIATQLHTVRDRLREGGLAPVRYRDPVSGDWREDVPTYGHLALLLRLYAYQPQAAAMLPLIVHEASQGRYAGLLAQARLIYGDVDNSIMQGMSLSVTCTEDGDLTPDPADAATVMGTEFAEYLLAQCQVENMRLVTLDRALAVHPLVWRE